MVSGKQPSTCGRRSRQSEPAQNRGGPGRTHLHPEQVLALVPLQERPLGLLPLQEVGAHRHLPAGDVGAEALAHAAEGQVPALRNGERSTSARPAPLP